jgi:hypothetical protein
LTGKEYAKLMEFLRRCHAIPPPTPDPAPSPSRLIFSQPISELRPAEAQPPEAPKPPDAKPDAPPPPPKPGGEATRLADTQP